MNPELFPILSGLLAGAIIGLLRPALRLWAGFLLSVLLGALATFLSGESEISWAFLLVDIPLVAVASLFSLAVVKRLRAWPAGENR